MIVLRCDIDANCNLTLLDPNVTLPRCDDGQRGGLASINESMDLLAAPNVRCRVLRLSTHGQGHGSSGLWHLTFQGSGLRPCLRELEVLLLAADLRGKFHSLAKIRATASRGRAECISFRVQGLPALA